MNTVRILHRVDDSAFFEASFAPDEFALREAYEYENTHSLLDIPLRLEDAWRENNRVDGSDIEKVPDGIRSLSVGDVVIIGESAWAVAGIGFEIIGAEVVAEALTREGNPARYPHKETK